MSPLANSLVFLQAQPDARLVSLARAGHERAFEALVKRYRRPLLAYCRRIAASDGNAEDVLQQALMQAWAALRDGVEVREPRAWLYRIVHNLAASDSRRTAPRPVAMYEIEGAPSADDAVEQRMVARAALESLAALPAMQRQAMVGTALEGLSHEEVARDLGLTSGAVRGLIYRARSTLRAAAAALIPSPLLGWAIRHGAGATGGSSVAEATVAAGVGSAGLGSALLRGGAVAATAGALITSAGITVGNHLRGHPGADGVGRVEGGSEHHSVNLPSASPARADFVASPAPEGSTAPDSSSVAVSLSVSAHLPSAGAVREHGGFGDRGIARLTLLSEWPQRGSGEAQRPGRTDRSGAGSGFGAPSGGYRESFPSAPWGSNGHRGRYGESSGSAPRSVWGTAPPSGSRDWPRFGSGVWSGHVSAPAPAPGQRSGSTGAGSRTYGGSIPYSGTDTSSGAYGGSGSPTTSSSYAGSGSDEVSGFDGGAGAQTSTSPSGGVASGTAVPYSSSSPSSRRRLAQSSTGGSRTFSQPTAVAASASTAQYGAPIVHPTRSGVGDGARYRR